jgi:MFS family permease
LDAKLLAITKIQCWPDKKVLEAIFLVRIPDTCGWKQDAGRGTSLTPHRRLINSRDAEYNPPAICKGAPRTFMRKPSVFVVWLTVFIDLIGFGIVVPLVPVFAKRFDASSYAIGLVLASFSLLQFIFAPIWGRLSDRIGRRPVLLLSTAGATVSYAIFAFGSGQSDAIRALIILGVARAFAGAFGGNITVAQAYIADITAAENRSKRMGLIGMAFGLGFIVGPAIGGLSLKHMGITGPGWVAAALCAVNFAFAWWVLPESRQGGGNNAEPRPHLSQWLHTLSQPGIGLLVMVFFLSTLCFSCFEVTLALLVCDNFNLDIKDDATTATVATYLFVFCGLISALVQGGMIGKVVKRFGEPRVIAASLVFTATSLALLPFVKGNGVLSWQVLGQPDGRAWWVLLGVLALLAVGSSLTRPPLFGLLSNLTSADEQGANIGVAQGAASLARIIGQFSAPIFLIELSSHTLYLGCAIALAATCGLVVQKLGKCAVNVGEKVGK